jgi:hypothetical protein
MDHEPHRERVLRYQERSSHAINYYDGGHNKEQPKVPRNKNPKTIWDGSETFAINARHR